MENLQFNTVILDLNEYNKMKLINDTLIKGEIIYLGYGLQGEIYYPLDSFALKEKLVIENKRLNDTIAELNKMVSDLKYPERKKLELSDIKKMSVWQFLRWKKK